MRLPGGPPALRNLATLVLVLVVYFAVPVKRLGTDWSAVASVVGLLLGIVLLAWLITGQVRRHMRADADHAVRIQSLLMLLYLAVLLFALGYFVLARSTDDQFAGLETRVDALYFTMTTLATVGFGDVHASGQLARALVIAQLAFNLVFIGALVSVLSSRLRQRAQSAR
jgi:voltage-gated potassium channel